MPPNKKAGQTSQLALTMAGYTTCSGSRNVSKYTVSINASISSRSVYIIRAGPGFVNCFFTDAFTRVGLSF